MMINILAAIVCLFSFVCVKGQTVYRSETIRTTDLGNQKLEKVGDEYYIKLATGNAFQKEIAVSLGEKEKAVSFLQNLYDLRLKRGDMVSFDNKTNNTAIWSGLNGYTVYSSGKMLKGHLRKRNIKLFIDAIKKK